VVGIVYPAFMLRWVGQLRWLWLVFTLPPVLLWARAFPYAGVPMVVAHCALVLLHGVLHDRSAFQSRDEPRLTLWGPRLVLDAPFLVPHATVLILLCLGMIVAAAVVDPLVAGVMTAGLLAVIIGHRFKRLFGRWRSRLAEVWLPGVALVAPMFALSSIAERNQAAAMRGRSDPGLAVALPEVITRATETATVLWAMVMAVFILACHTRDEPHDRCDGLLTTPTVFGPRGAAIAMALWAGGVMLLGANGNGHRLWTWPVLGSLGVGAMLVAWFCGAEKSGRAVVAWVTCAAVAGVCLVGRITV
jgi:hypothetical protein